MDEEGLKVKLMYRWLLLGTLLAVVPCLSGCMSCGGYGCGIRNGYSVCDPCGGGFAAAYPTMAPVAFSGNSPKYVSPYAGQYYSGDECSSYGGCGGGCGGCGESFRPLGRWCGLLSYGGNSCGCACEKYFGDYINNPPDLCLSCDRFGGLAGFSGQCNNGSCGSCDSCSGMPGVLTRNPPISYSPVSYSLPYQPMQTPPASECKTCNQGNNFSANRQVLPQSQVQAFPGKGMLARNTPMLPGAYSGNPPQPVIIAQSRQIPRMSPQPVFQDKLVSTGPQLVNYRLIPVRQVSVGQNEQQFGSTNKVIQPATIPSNGRIIHAN